MKILITGASGLIGGALVRHLAGSHELVALNRSDVAGLATHRADIADADAIRPAFDGAAAVIHLAAKAGEHYRWQELLDTNVTGTRNVFEAARDAGVQRVVFASSGATVSGWEHEEPYRSLVNGGDLPARWAMIDCTQATRPSGVYGSTKVWGEALARHLSDSAGLHAFCLRIGYVNAEDRPTAPRHASVWCSQRDIVAALTLALDATAEQRFGVCFAVSNNRRNYRDLDEARRVLGFVPQDSADDR